MSFFANFQVNGANPSTVGGTGTAAKYFTAPSRNFTSGVSTTPSSSSAVGQLSVPGNGELNGQTFFVTASGDFEVGSGGACPSVTIDIQANTGTLTSPTYTTIITSGAITAQNLTGTLYSWFLEGQMSGTTASGILSGIQYGSIDNTARAQIALTSALSGLNFGSSSPVFGLVARVTFSVSEAGNLANLYQFNLHN